MCMRSFDYYRTYLTRAFSHAFVDSSRPADRLALLRAVWMNRSKYEKAVAVFQCLKSFIPDFVNNRINYEKFFRYYGQLPINPDRYELKQFLSSGHNSNVYLLSPKESYLKPLVLKVQFVAGSDSERTIKTASADIRDFEMVKAFYGFIPNLIPDQFTFVMTSPQRPFKRAVVGAVQEYIGEQVRDVATEIDKEEWLQLIKLHPEIGVNLRSFVAITDKIFNEQGLIIDIMGKRNLVVGQKPFPPRLVFLDCSGIKRFDQMDASTRKLFKQRMDALILKVKLSQVFQG